MTEGTPFSAIVGAGSAKIRVALAVAVALLFVVIVPLVFATRPYFLNVLTNASILALVSLGVWVTFSIGRINISQGAFAMIGGYTTAILETRYGVTFWICLPLSAITAAFAGTLIGIPVLRLKGVYFAMISLSLTEAVRLLFLNGGDFTQGATGITNIPRPFGVSGAVGFYLISAGLLVLGMLTVWRLSTSRIGAVFRSLRQNEDLAASVGINVARYRLIAFALSSALGGMGGAFYATFQQNIYPATYSVNDLINFMLYCFFGGLNYVFGPVIGAFLLIISFEILQSAQKYQTLIYGVLMIAVMLWLPNGLLSLNMRWLRNRS